MGAKEAADYLRWLLTQPGPVRERWQRRARPTLLDDISLAGINNVIAEYLWETGERPDCETALPRTIRHKVSRAVSGTTLTGPTLAWFVGAFDIPEADARRLEALRTGSSTVRALHGRATSVLERTRQVHTLSLNEHHFIGLDRAPVLHRTTQVLEAKTDGVDSYDYIFDTNALSLDVVRGGTATGPITAVADGLFAARIRLNQPLRTAGDTTVLEYRTTFHYSEPPEPEFRRACFTPVDAVSIRVQFHPQQLPRAVYCAQWPALDQPALRLRQEAPDAEHAVHMFLQHVERAIVGFEWCW